MTDPSKKVEQVKESHWRKLKRLFNRAQRVPESALPLPQKVALMDDIVHDFIKPFAAVAACRNGCSHCCHQSVLISKFEADRIANHSGRVPVRARGIAGEDAIDGYAIVKRYSGKPCPFLSAGRCTVYAVRPYACKLHLNMGDDPSVCDTITNPGKTVPMLNVDAFILSIVQMFVRADQRTFDDIRHFFPTPESEAGNGQK
jgi:Fe-S-cluster containining protein